MKLGIDLLDPRILDGSRVALLANYASRNAKGIASADVLREHLVRLFAPEHGYWGDTAYLEDVPPEEYDGLPVESLYGTQSAAQLAPTPEQLRDVDVLVVDLQDVGARYYTYAATLGNCMAVAAQTGTRVIVLDRPNPINGRDVEGNVNLAAPYLTFVGQYPLPIRHGMTIGELAAYINATAVGRCDLEVVKMQGWTRAMWWDDTGLPWTHPSPNMATPETALVYPGACLFEGTNVSEGRGTTHPFELIGAPWLDERKIAELEIPGARLEPFCFKPAFNKHAGERCRGVFVRVTNRHEFQPVRAYMRLLKAIRDAAPDQFRWYDGFYEYANVPAIDALTGSSEYRTLVERGTLRDVEQWIEAAEERRRLVESARQAALFAEYDETPRAVITPPRRGVTDMPLVIEVPRAEA